jgi:7-cyano-7-deazaguanine synthase
MNAVALLSGGMDSTVSLFWAMKTGAYESIVPVFFDYEQNAAREELARVRRILELRPPTYQERLVVIPMMMPVDKALTRGGIKQYINVEQAVEDTANNDAYIPFRNGILFAMAASYLLSVSPQGGHIITGIRGRPDGTGFPDCTTRFAVSFSMAATCGTGETVGVIAPLNSLSAIQSRADVIRLAETLGCSEALAQTYSCHVGRARPCGYCLPCLRRAEAFAEVGIEDPAL